MLQKATYILIIQYAFAHNHFPWRLCYPRRYNLQLNRSRSYNHKYSFLSVHARINKWGDRAKDAVRKELKMFVKVQVFEKVINPTVKHMEKALMIHYL
jgi:hypothetical protein